VKLRCLLFFPNRHEYRVLNIRSAVAVVLICVRIDSRRRRHQLSFENLADWRALARIGRGGIDLYCRSFVRPRQRIILDMDASPPFL